mmetsp:Transcript_40252/g.116370  ORF Transcript_40252/g.116370 Transcript_40252/m.116370 type:complete len:308 (+) Transcript_40252:101-1024(+)
MSSPMRAQAAIPPPPGLEDFVMPTPPGLGAAPRGWAAPGSPQQRPQLLFQQQQQQQWPLFPFQQQQQPMRQHPSTKAQAEVSDLLSMLMKNIERPSVVQMPAASPFRGYPVAAPQAPLPTQGLDSIQYGDKLAAWGAVQVQEWQRPGLAVDTCSSLGQPPSSHSDAGSWDSGLPESDVSEAAAQGATVMITNLPRTCAQDLLLKHWPIDGKWNLMYLPWNTRERCNHGFVFINFVTEAQAAEFRSKWHGAFLSGVPADSPLSTTMANVQGLEANIAQLKKKRVDRIRIRNCKPIILRNGQRVDLKDF